MFDILEGLVERSEALVISVMVVMTIVFVAMTWVRTRSFLHTLGAILGGSIILFGISNMRDLADLFGDDVEKQGRREGIEVDVEDVP